jgi:hypothetical protein
MHKSIKLVENPDDAEIETIPHPVEAAGGDTLSWKSDEGEIRVTFADPEKATTQRKSGFDRMCGRGSISTTWCRSTTAVQKRCMGSTSGRDVIQPLFGQHGIS